MTTQPSGTIAGMTLEQLRALIAQEVEIQLNTREQESDSEKAAEAVRQLIANPWTPPPGTPSVIEMIRQDRDR